MATVGLFRSGVVSYSVIARSTATTVSAGASTSAKATADRSAKVEAIQVDRRARLRQAHDDKAN